MSQNQTDVSYSCGSCGYPLNLKSSNRITSGIGSEYQKSIKRGVISFRSIDLSRFTLVDKINCFLVAWARHRSKTKLLCRRCAAPIGSYHLNRLLARFPHLQSLSLSGCTELPDSGLTQLQSSGHNLRALLLDCCFGITDSGISLIATSCPNLEVISLYRCLVTDAGLEVLACSCTSLRDVNLAYCSLITDTGLSALSQRCRELRAVKISFCRSITGIGFKGCSQTLVHVDAESCKLEPEGVTAIVSGSGLEYLNVSSMSWGLGANGLRSIGGGFCRRLKILNFRMCRTVGDESVSAIAKGCPLLEEWNLALCHEVKLQGWESIGKFCNSLERLHVNRCRNLCDRGFQALREGCRKLSILYISRAYRSSEHAIELFKLQRGRVEIREEEVMCIGPDWTCR